MSNDHLTYLAAVAEIYFAGRYSELAEHAMLRRTLPTPPEAWLLIQLACQRVDRRAKTEMGVLLGQMLESAGGDPLFKSLLRIVLGKMPLETALAVDRDKSVDHRCRCFFYAAARLQTNDEWVAAAKTYEECLRVRAPVLEHTWAAWALRGQVRLFQLYSKAPNPRDYEGVPKLLWEASQRLHDAPISAQQALTDAENKLSTFPRSSALAYALLMCDLAALVFKVKGPIRAAELLCAALEAMASEDHHYPGTVLGIVDKCKSLAPNFTHLLPYLERAIVLQELIDDAPEKVASRLDDFAKCAAASQKFDMAITALRKGLELKEPGSFDAYCTQRFLVQNLLQIQNKRAALKELLHLLAYPAVEVGVPADWTTQELTIALHLANGPAGMSLVEEDMNLLQTTVERVDNDPIQNILRYMTATLLQRRGQHWSAIPILRSLGQLLTDNDRLAVYFALATSYRAVDETALAIESICKCKDLLAGTSHEHAFDVGILEAEILFQSDKPAEALAALQRVSVLLADDLRRRHTYLNVMAGYFGPRGHYEVLGPQLVEFADLVSRQVDVDDILPAALNNAAVAAMSTGKIDLAKRLFERVLGANGEDWLPTSDSIALSNYAKTYALQAQFSDALRWLTRAMQVETQAIHAMLAAASDRQRIASLEKMRDSFDTWLSSVFSVPQEQRDTRAIAETILQRKGVDLEVLTAQRRLSVSPDCAQTIPVLRELAAIQQESIAYGWAQLAGAEVDWTIHRTAFAEKVQPYLTHFWDDCAREPPIGFTLKDAKPAEALTAERKARVEELQQRLAVHWKHAQGATDPLSVTLKDVQSRLGPQEALVEYVSFRQYDFTRVNNNWGPRKYAAIVLRSGDTKPHLFDLGEANAIDMKIREFLNHMTGVPSRIRGLHLSAGRRTSGRWHTAAADLFTQLLKPLESALRGVNKLKIAPDGQTSLFPFELLQSDGAPLVEGYFIEYLTSGRDLLPRDVSSRQQNESIVVAAPDFDLSQSVGSPVLQGQKNTIERGLNEANANFTHLPGALAEGEAVAAILSCPLLKGEDALDGRIKKLSSPRVLHFATHAFYEERPAATRGSTFTESLFPAEAGLVLAGANTFLRGRSLPEEAEDGFLFADEVTLMDLAGTDLVTLSACETGLGAVLHGEGVTGLRRAFIASGARTLIVSLWKVPDSDTSRFMIVFYSRLKSGVDCSQALSLTKEEFRDRGEDPKLWAAFICIGRPDTCIWPKPNEV